MRTLRAIGRIPGITYVEVRDISGRRFVELGGGVVLDRTVAGQGANTEPSPLELLLGGDIRIETRIINSGRHIGTLSLFADTTELRSRLISGLWDAVIAALIAMALGIALAARMQNTITNPLRQLTRAMTRVRETSDFNTGVEKHSDDETGTLVEAFNDMLSQIRARDDRIAKHQEHLEEEVQDRTRDLHAAKNTAEAANAAKSEFLATMSHEIRTPMNGMLVMAELLATAELPPRHQRYADVITRSGQSLLSIINDILDFSKIESGKLELEQVTVNPSNLLDDVLNLFWERASSKGLDLAGFVSPDVPLAFEGDPVRINQVLSNLVNNALKFTETGHVFVTIDRDPAHDQDDAICLRFSVADTGIGIAADKLDAVFESFSQADQSTTRQYGGTGLGLAICKRLVNAMHGEIGVESRLGEGSVFSFSMKARAIEQAPRLLADATSRIRRAIVAATGSATQLALTHYLQASSIDVQAASPDTLDHGSLGEVDVIFTEPEYIARLNKRLNGLDADAMPKLVCLSQIGDSQGDALIEAGKASDLLMLPLARDLTRDCLERLITGRAPDRSKSGRRAGAQTELPNLTGTRVLVADDSPVNREVIIEALTRLKVDVHTVPDGKAAVDAVAAEHFDLVFMDCSMPVMDGFEATRQIRQRENDTAGPRLPVVALTAHVAGGPANLWHDSGMDDCITKPFTIKTLITCFENHLADRINDVPTPEAHKDGIESNTHNAGIDAKAGAVTGADADVNAGAGANEVPAIDPATLDAIGGIGADDAVELLERIFGLYEAHAPDALSHLEQQMADGDADEIADAAHALKSLSFSVGATRVAGVCGTLEAEARNSSGLTFDHHLDGIRKELALAMNEIAALKVAA